jgi:integrase
MFSQAATVEAFARRYLEELAGAGIGAQTLEQCRHIFRAHISRSDLAAVPLRELNDGHIKLWLAQLQQKTVGARAERLQPQHREQNPCVRTMITLAWKRGEIGRPVDRINLVDNLPMKAREPDPFSPKELLTLLAACEGQQRGLYITLALTGMRPSGPSRCSGKSTLIMNASASWFGSSCVMTEPSIPSLKRNVQSVMS